MRVEDSNTVLNEISKHLFAILNVSKFVVPILSYTESENQIEKYYISS